MLIESLTVFFLMWLVLTATNQVSWPALRGVRILERHVLLPRWTFFAPNPGSSDFTLTCRYYVPGGVTDWRKVCQPSSRSPLHVLWNPRKVEAKALSDVIEALREVTSALADSPRLIEVSWPYLVLSRFCAANAPRTAERLQFAILSSREHASAGKQIMFMSPVCRLQ